MVSRHRGELKGVGDLAGSSPTQAGGRQAPISQQTCKDSSHNLTATGVVWVGPGLLTACLALPTPYLKSEQFEQLLELLT